MRGDGMLRAIERVFHVGSLDPASRTCRPSLEGPCLSVSVDPEDWGRIARVAGPTWTLERPGAKWLDACNLADEEMSRIMGWAEREGLAAPATVWRAWHSDDEADSWSFLQLPSGEAALAEAEGRDLEGEEIPSLTGGPVDSMHGWTLTAAGMSVLERWADELDGEGGAIILYAMLKPAPKDPDLAGIWWDEIHDPLSLSCPRGGVLPGRLDLFEIRDERGALPPFRVSGEMEP
jgi:hypothetical protein